MGFEFFKLAEVDVNSVVDDETYILVVNGSDVQRTNSKIVNGKFYSDMTSDYKAWVDVQPATTPTDIASYVKGLIPIDNNSFVGYIDSEDNGTAMFEVLGTIRNPKQHVEIFYKRISYGQTIPCIRICDFINGSTLSDNTYEITSSNKLMHYDESDTTLLKGVEVRNNLSTVGNASIGSNLNVYGEAKGNKFIAGSVTKNVSLEDNSITMHGQNIDVIMDYNNDGKVNFKTGNNEAVNITGVGAPISSNDATNKNYVDEMDNSLRNDYISRINSIIAKTSSSNVCCIKKPYFYYDTQTEDYVFVNLGDSSISGSVPVSQVETKFVVSVSGTGIADKIDFLCAYYTLSNDPDERHYDATVTYNADSANSYTIEATVPYDIQDNPYVSNMYIVYLESITDINLPELAALRNPYDYTGVIDDYSTTNNYSEGDYCYYPDSTDGRLYVCLSSTTGVWDDTKWEAVFARDSIEKALSGVLKKDGSIAMTGNFDAGSNRIVNVANPTSGTDATNKNYIDNKGLHLNEDGILSWG